MGLADLDVIARSSSDRVSQVISDVQDSLGVSDQELSFMRPTIAASVHNLGEDYVGLAILSSMARVKGKKLRLMVCDDDKDEVFADVNWKQFSL